ncbi:secreted protein containing DUF1566 [Candidatus Magnetomorum sp. HK-1]|nr:secreted protein containing DUF1566 [Candidatus Magnetomorum sp. HK-1]
MKNNILNRSLYFIKILVGLTCLFLLPQNSFSNAIPDTGQKQSYTDINGEDSDYQINVQSYTKLDEKAATLSQTAETFAMVRDEITGLVWEVKKTNETIQGKNKLFSWYNSDDKTNGGNAGLNGDNTDTSDLVRALNNQHYGGYTDWRLPTIYELATLLNMSNTTNGIQTKFFPNTEQGPYWTSTTYAGSTQKAWQISFITGKNSYNDKSTTAFVRAVRGSADSLILSRFEDNADGTVTDTLTGLIWQKQDEQNPMTWEQSLTEINSLLLGDYMDWRMPTREELRSIVDYSRTVPSILSTVFPSAVSGNYWTSTAHPYQSGHVWCVHFYNGNDNYQTANNSYYSRAVRGGQHQTETGIIILSPAQGSIWQKEAPMSIKWETRGIGGDVEISISRNGAKFGAFDIISGHETNDGEFNWMVQGDDSHNCALQIVPLNAPEKGNIQSFFRIIPAQIPVLEVSPLELTVSPLSGIQDIAIINEGSGQMDWQVVVQEPWLHIQNNVSGTDNYGLRIQFDSNSGSARIGHVVITASGAMNSPKTVLINQQAGYSIIKTIPNTQTVSASVDVVSFTITNTGTTYLAWTATTEDDWLTFVGETTGTDTGQIMLRTDQNKNDTRTGTIVITAPGAINSPTSITVVQEAGHPVLYVTPDTQTASAWSNTVGFTVYNAGAGMMTYSAVSLTDWLILEGIYSGINTGVILVRYRSNYGDSRTGSVKISTDDGQVKTVYVKQLAGFPILSVTPDTQNVSGNYGETTFSIDNNGSGTMTWSAQSNNSWLTIVSDNSGNDAGTIRVKYDKNPGNARTGYITISAPDAQIETVRVSVYQETQKGYYPPDWTINPKDYQFQCMVIGLVYNNDSQPMIQENDILAAFINNECRGMAYPKDSPFGKRYFLQVWSNTQNDPVIFKFFDSDTGTVFNRINEKIIFQVNSSIGTLGTPFKIITSNVDVNLPLQNGWNWVSLNVRKEDMSLESVLSSLDDQCEVVVGQSGFSQYYAGKWYGLVDRIEPAQMYLLKMVGENTLSYAGEPVYFENINIYLDKGWNWIGYLPYFEQDINIALQSLGSYGDRIVGQGGFSEYYDGWWGSLTTLKPHQGYQIKLHESAVLNYPNTDPNTGKRSSNQNNLVKTQKQYNNFQYPACLTIQLKNSSQKIQIHSQDKLLAISNTGEIRGLAQTDNSSGTPVFFLQTWLESTKETIYFEYLPSGKPPIIIEQSLFLEAYDVIGNIKSPLLLTVRQYNLPLLIQQLKVLAGLHPVLDENNALPDINGNMKFDLSEILYFMKYGSNNTSMETKFTQDFF